MTRQIKAAALAATFVVGAYAAAQQSTLGDTTPSNMAVRGGIFLAIDDNLRDVNDSMVAFGVDFIVQAQYLKNSTTYLSVDWLGKDLSGADVNIFPICINQKFNLGVSQGYKTYGFVGVGATIYDIDSSDTVFGARGGLGVELGPNIFAEGTLYWSDKTAGDITNLGTGIYLGYRW
jgi:hypothetical protein